MPLSWLDHLGSVASIFSLLFGLPALLAASYQVYKARQEARQIREGWTHSQSCLEFIVRDGTTVNVVPLETLNWLPREGDIILLPGDGTASTSKLVTGAYLVESIEHYYAPATHKRRRRQEARLSKVVCAVTTINPTFTGGLNLISDELNEDSQEDCVS